MGGTDSHLFLFERGSICVDFEPESLGRQVFELSVDEADRPHASRVEPVQFSVLVMTVVAVHDVHGRRGNIGGGKERRRGGLLTRGEFDVWAGGWYLFCPWVISVTEVVNWKLEREDDNDTKLLFERPS